jgi:hypothetical protein
MKKSELDPHRCPICQQNNACGNLENPASESCWCRDAELTFPKALIETLPSDMRNKACICRRCVQAYLDQQAQLN